MKKSEEISVGQRQANMLGSIIIRGGHVIDPSQGIDAERDLLLRDGIVAEIAPTGTITGDGEEVFDARGLIVSPGLIDIHVHLREPGQAYKETIASGTAAAAAGGFTSVCPMPNTSPVNDNAEITAWMQAPQRLPVVNVFPIAAATVGCSGMQGTDIPELKRAGAVAVSDDGRPILADDVMRAVMLVAAQANLPVVQHAEDTRLTARCMMGEGVTAFRLGLRGMPVEAESRIVERDIKLAEKTGARLHIAHLSTAESLQAVREAKGRGVLVTCEVAPHHFTLIDENVENYDTRFKMNPPLRSSADREALILGIVDGTVDAIASDHAPHATHEKSVEFDRAPFGITGLETTLGLAITKLHVEHKVPLTRIVELLSTNPARIVGLKNRGTLALGAHADVTIFDPKKKWKFSVEKSRSKARNTPFDGWKLTGKAVVTIVSGQIVFQAG